MIALIHFCVCKPAFERGEATQSSAHSYDLIAIGLVKNSLYCLKLRNDRFKQVATLLVLHQVELVDDKEFHIEVELLLD